MIKTDTQLILERINSFSDIFIGKTILLSGSNGFLGRHFSSVLKYLHCKVIMLDNLLVPNELAENYNVADFTFYQHDITKPFQTKEKIDYIINCAGIASPYWYSKFPLETLDLGIIGLKNMLALSAEHKARLLYFSSSEVYGTPDKDNIPTKEIYIGQIQTMGERSCYDVSKLVGETLCHIFNNHYGSNAVICRPFNFFSSNMSENDGRVLPSFRQKIKNNEPLQINSGGSQTRSFCHIIDALDGCFRVLALGQKNQVYNIGNPSTEVSMIDLVKAIEKVLGKKLEVKMDETPKVYSIEPMRRCPDITKVSGLGYTPLLGLEQGLARFFEVGV